MPKKPIIAVDLDDVLGDENTAVMHFINARYGTSHTPEDYQIPGEYWSYWQKVWGVDDAEGDAWYDTFVKAKQRYEVVLEPMPGAIQVLNKLKSEYDLTIVTSRKAELLEVTERWLEEYFPATFSDVHFVDLWGGKDKVTKARICNEIGADFLIDDNAEHCNLADEAGVQALLFGDYGWSRGAKISKRIVRVQDWWAILEYFDGKRS